MSMIAVAPCENVKLKARLYETGNLVNRKFTVLAKDNLIGKRLIEAFGTDDKAVIAEKLGFSSVQAVYKVINGERELDFEKLQNFRNYTKRSIDWLLTGEEQAGETSRSAAKEEFDIEAAIRVNDNPRLVMEQWYDFQGLPVPEDFVSTLSLDQWDARPIDTKVKQIRAMRAIYERNKERQKMYASTKAESS
jgi:hypothetical protein